MTFDPKSVEVTCVTLPKDHYVQVPWKYIKVCEYSDLFSKKVCEYSDPSFKNLNQRSLTPRWPLTPHLLRSHVWLYPRIIVSKSHGNTSTYVDTVINFAKYHILRITIHTTYRMNDHSLFLNTVQARKKASLVLTNSSSKFTVFYMICDLMPHSLFAQLSHLIIT